MAAVRYALLLPVMEKQKYQHVPKSITHESIGNPHGLNLQSGKHGILSSLCPRGHLAGYKWEGEDEVIEPSLFLS